MYHRRKFVPMSCGSVRNKLLCLRVQRNLKFSLSGCWVANGWNPCSRSRRCGDRSMAFFPKHTSSSERSLSKSGGHQSSAEESSAQCYPEHQLHHQNDETRQLRSWWIVSCRSRCHKRKTFSIWSSVVPFWTQWGCDQNDPKGQKSYDETRVQNPQSCVGFCCLIGSTWTPKSKSNTLTPKTNSLTCRLKVTSPVMSGVILLVCSTSWILRCFLPATFFQWINAIPCRRGRCRKENQEKELVLAKSKVVRLVSWIMSVNQSPMLDSGTSYSPRNCVTSWNSDLTRIE